MSNIMNIKASVIRPDFRHQVIQLKNFIPFGCLSLLILCLIFLIGCTSETKVDESQINMFDGKSIGKWQVSDFFGSGKVYVKDGAIFIEKSSTGGYMQGITWTGPIVKMNYEITLEAMRVEGSDFFCGLTFPVGESPCTLILGGWGGTLCGLSSLDSYDASENETTTFINFNQNQWYKVRLKVTPDKIQAWLDDEPLVDIDTIGKHIDIRFECMPCLPLGIATYMTTGAIRDIKLQKIEEKPDLNTNYDEDQIFR
jgi:hypothetical protein